MLWDFWKVVGAIKERAALENFVQGVVLAPVIWENDRRLHSVLESCIKAVIMVVGAHEVVLFLIVLIVVLRVDTSFPRT
jgi:hypothetical protein